MEAIPFDCKSFFAMAEYYINKERSERDSITLKEFMDRLSHLKQTTEIHTYQDLLEYGYECRQKEAKEWQEKYGQAGKGKTLES
jgi:hypothetical protein